MILTTPSRMITTLMVLFGVFVASVSAREVLRGSTCTVSDEQTINGTLFVLCETLTIDGTVNGNVIGLALRTTLNGTVSGSVYLAGGELTVNGQIGDSLHNAGVRLRLLEGAKVGGSLFSGTLTTRIESGVSIGANVVSVGYELFVGGTIAQEVNFWGAGLSINGVVSGDVYASVGDPASDGDQIRTLLLPFGFDVVLPNPGMVMAPNARIMGQLSYTGPVEGDIQGRIIGETTFTKLSAPLPNLNQPATLTIYWENFVREFSALVAIGLLMWGFISPTALQRPINQMRLRPLASFSVGMLAFLLSFPIVLIVALLSGLLIVILSIVRLDGVAVAALLLLGVVNGTAIGAFYFVAIYGGRVLVAWALGRFLLGSLRPQMTARTYSVSTLVVGVFFLALGASLPIYGWVVNALALFLGLGTMITGVLGRVQQVRDTPPMPMTPQTPLFSLASVLVDMPPSLPPAPTPDAPPALGMDNLPEGFDQNRFFG